MEIWAICKAYRLGMSFGYHKISFLNNHLTRMEKNLWKISMVILFYRVDLKGRVIFKYNYERNLSKAVNPQNS